MRLKKEITKQMDGNDIGCSLNTVISDIRYQNQILDKFTVTRDIGCYSN